MFPIEKEGRTVAEAVDAALRGHGLRRDQVEVAVLDEGSAGFMGLGAKPARVRLTEKRWGPDTPNAGTDSSAPARPPRATTRPTEPYREEVPPPHAVGKRPETCEEPRPAREQQPRALSPEDAVEACRKAQEIVEQLLRLMSIAAPTVAASWDPQLERVKVSVESQDAPLLVGRDGRVLESLQFLSTLMLSRGGDPVVVQVDALSYWEKREVAVLDQARDAAESVRATGRSVRLEPMNASMRRLVHRTFSASPDIATVSEGEGSWRKVVIRPRKA